MNLSETSEARIRGYLYVLKRSLPGWLPAATAADAVREVESHIREKAAAVEPLPDERAAVERILDHLGSPSRVAAAYATEMAVDEAVATGKILAVARALGRLAVSTATGFLVFLGLFTGYGMALAFFLIAAMKPIVPDHVGLIRVNGRFRSLGIDFDLPPGATVEGGYWIIPISIVLGLVLSWVTHRAARAVLRRWQARRGGPPQISAGAAPVPGTR
jgi:uncharacterized membrane protein